MGRVGIEGMGGERATTPPPCSPVSKRRHASNPPPHATPRPEHRSAPAATLRRPSWRRRCSGRRSVHGMRCRSSSRAGWDGWTKARRAMERRPRTGCPAWAWTKPSPRLSGPTRAESGGMSRREPRARLCTGRSPPPPPSPPPGVGNAPRGCMQCSGGRGQTISCSGSTGGAAAAVRGCPSPGVTHAGRFHR